MNILANMPGSPESNRELGEVAELVRAGGAVLRHRFPLLLAPFLTRDVIALTLGRRIYLRPGLVLDARVRRVLLHELEHVRQYREEGMIPFLYTYLREYMINRANGMDPLEAYRSIPFEEQARAAEKEGPSGVYNQPGSHSS